MGIDYEIVVVDNGSPQPIDEAELQRLAPNTRVIRVAPALPSPARAISRPYSPASGFW